MHLAFTSLLHVYIVIAFGSVDFIQTYNCMNFVALFNYLYVQRSILMSFCMIIRFTGIEHYYYKFVPQFRLLRAKSTVVARFLFTQINESIINPGEKIRNLINYITFNAADSRVIAAQVFERVIRVFSHASARR